MSFLSLIIRNLLRHRVRSLLTIVGISIGIATIVTLGVITEGLKGTVEEALTAVVALRGLSSGLRVPYDLIMAGSVLIVLPLVILFIVLQKQFIAGITSGAIKG